MKFLLVAALVATSYALVAAHDHHDKHHGDDHHSHPKYEFQYGVKDTKTGDIKQQWEHRDGDHVKGSYSLKESDGTTRVVDYHANDHGGFHADVKRIGHAHHPDTHTHHHDHAHGGDYDGHYYGGHHDVHHDDYHHGHGHATSYANIHQHH